MQSSLLKLVDEATRESVGGLINQKVGKSEISQRVERKTLEEVTAIIELSENESFLLSLDKEGIYYLCEKMLGERFPDLSEEALDTVGEITNIIVGAFKRKVERHSITYKMARPVVIQGKGIRFSLISKCSLTTLKFPLERGNLFVEVTVDSIS